VKHILIRDVSVYYSNYYQSYSNRMNKIDNGLSNKPKRFLLKYVSHNFGSAISDYIELVKSH